MTGGGKLKYQFDSKFLSNPANFSQREHISKIGTEIKQSVPEGMERNADYKIGLVQPGKKTIPNKLGKKPSRIIKGNEPGAATYTVSSWNKKEIVLNIEEPGTINFWVS